MSQDIIADGLNEIMNARVVEKKTVTLNRYSELLINVLAMMKQKGHIEYSVDEAARSVTVTLKNLHYCKAIKPRYATGYQNLDKYLRRFLPSRNFGTVIVSTSKGLMAHQDALATKTGGSLIAYFY